MNIFRITSSRSFAFFTLFSLTSHALLMSGTVGAAMNSQKLHVKQVRLYDVNGFGQPLLARTFLLPAEWQVDGGVRWSNNADPQQPAYYESFSAVSPDGRATFELLPSYSWVWLTDPQARQMMVQLGQDSRLAAPLNATGVVQEYIIPNYRPGATVIAIQPRPDLAHAYRQQLVRLGLQQLEENGCRVTLDFIEAKLSYFQNGERYIESAVVQLFRADFSSGIQSFTASNLFLFKAPAGEWNEHQFIYATAMRSMRQNPTWMKAINRFNNNMARIQMQGAIRRQQIMHQMYDDLRVAQQESWEYRQESIDRVAREFTESIREVETYRDPSTGFDVELPNTYDYAFSNGLGEYIVTNDPLYDPGQDLIVGNWERLQPIR